MATRSSALERVAPTVLVGVGGFAGAALRHALAVAAPAGFPWGTLAANVLGSLALGALLSETRVADAVRPEVRLAAGTGFLSSFTTYSTFAAETAALAPSLAVANVAANYGLGLVGVLCGRRLARWAS